MVRCAALQREDTEHESDDAGEPAEDGEKEGADRGDDAEHQRGNAEATRCGAVRVVVICHGSSLADKRETPVPIRLQDKIGPGASESAFIRARRYYLCVTVHYSGP